MTNRAENLNQENLRYLDPRGKFQVGAGILPDLPNLPIHWMRFDTYDQALDEILGVMDA